MDCSKIIGIQGSFINQPSAMKKRPKLCHEVQNPSKHEDDPCGQGGLIIGMHAKSFFSC